MKHPLRYRFVRMWYRRHGAGLRQRGGVALCMLGGGVVVTAWGGRLVGVVRADG